MRAYAAVGLNRRPVGAPRRGAPARSVRRPVSRWCGLAGLGRGPDRPPQPRDLNAVLELETTRTPRALLGLLQEVERAALRTRDVHWGARTLDLDLILFADFTIRQQGFTVPHPGMEERRFVLAPLAELHPDLVVPGDGPADLAAARGVPGARHQAGGRVSAVGQGDAPPPPPRSARAPRRRGGRPSSAGAPALGPSPPGPSSISPSLRAPAPPRAPSRPPAPPPGAGSAREPSRAPAPAAATWPDPPLERAPSGRTRACEDGRAPCAQRSVSPPRRPGLSRASPRCPVPRTRRRASGAPSRRFRPRLPRTRRTAMMSQHQYRLGQEVVGRRDAGHGEGHRGERMGVDDRADVGAGRVGREVHAQLGRRTPPAADPPPTRSTTTRSAGRRKPLPTPDGVTSSRSVPSRQETFPSPAPMRRRSCRRRQTSTRSRRRRVSVGRAMVARGSGPRAGPARRAARRHGRSRPPPAPGRCGPRA